MHFSKGDIVYADMGSTVMASHIQRGWRPVVILDILQNGRIYTVIPFTSQKKKSIPTHVNVTDIDIPVISGSNVILCENCTITHATNIETHGIQYNVYKQNPEIWKKIVDGLSVQLSRKYDYCEQYVDALFRRGAIVHIKGISYPAIILSNEKNNEYSDNLTVAPLVKKATSQPKRFDIDDECFVVNHVAIMNIDEIDTIAMRRGLNNDIGEMNRVVISLMQELDQLPNDLIIVATTNRYDQLDSALVRRFTVCQKVDAYNREDAVRLLRMFFDFAETKMTDDQLHEWVEKRFPNTTTYYPSALTNAATQYLVDSIIASTMNPDDAQPEQTNKQVYILYEETPDCMGSGSTSREVAKTTSFPQALEMLKKGTGNTLVKRTRINGTLVETYWNEFSRQFE